MRILLSFLVVCFSPVFLFSQSVPLPLNFNSYAIKLSVAKDESLVLVTRAGEVGLTTSIKSEWRRSKSFSENQAFGPTLDNANFFNKDTGFVSGFISGKSGKYNIIYHTMDGGHSWKELNFGQDGWVDDAVNLGNGEAWLSVAGSGIAYTNDYGFSWKKFKIPEVKQRFSNIFFNSKGEGFIGSLWNMLAYTADNCGSWKIIPTPLDQKRYNKTNKGNRPEFNRVAIFGDYLLVKQEDLVFYSKKDTVDWLWLSEYDDFYTDPENSAIFFKTSKGNIVRVDYNLTPIHTYESITPAYSSRCKNGSLFIVTNNKVQQIDPNNRIVSVLFNTNQSSNIQPIYVGYTPNGNIGVLDSKAYRQKDYNGKWDYVFDFPFSISDGSISLIENNLLLYSRTDDSLFYFNLSGKLVAVKSKLKMADDFCKAGISKLTFGSGSQGCFHYYSDQLEYIYANGVFGNQIEVSSGSKHPSVLPENDEIREGDVMSFVKNIPSLFDLSKMPSIVDLGFTEKDYQQCKNDILEFKASLESQETKKRKKESNTKFYFLKNNLDFSRLLAIVDSIKYLDSERLNSMLINLTDLWSTTTNWKQFQLINNKNEVITITSRYYESNAFYLPWVVRLNGYSVTTTNMAINNFLKKVYPDFLGNGDKVAVLHALVKKIY